MILPTRRAVLAAPLMLAAGTARAQEDSVVRGPTRPQRLASLGPQSDGGVVREVLVAEGDRVAANDVLLRLDDEVQSARIGLARVAADRGRPAPGPGAAPGSAGGPGPHPAGRNARRRPTEWEVRQARARVDVAKAAADGAEERRRIEGRRLDLELAQQAQLVIPRPSTAWSRASIPCPAPRSHAGTGRSRWPTSRCWRRCCSCPPRRGARCAWGGPIRCCCPTGGPRGARAAAPHGPGDGRGLGPLPRGLHHRQCRRCLPGGARGGLDLAAVAP